VGKRGGIYGAQGAGMPSVCTGTMVFLNGPGRLILGGDID
jgi:hypothetical protein